MVKQTRINSLAGFCDLQKDQVVFIGNSKTPELVQESYTYRMGSRLQVITISRTGVEIKKRYYSEESLIPYQIEGASENTKHFDFQGLDKKLKEHGL